MEESVPEVGCDEHGSPCKTDIDLLEILKDDTFTFIIGNEKQRFNIHVSALKNISKPLGIMMTNGQMDESINKQAMLSDVDPDVFGMPVKYAYEGLCGISDAYAGLAPTLSLPLKFACHKCCDLVRKGYQNDPQYPFCSSGCRASYLNQFDQATSHNRNPHEKSHIWTLHCVADGSDISLGWTYRHRPLCYACIELGQGNSCRCYKDTLNQNNTGVSKCSPDFSAKKYGCPNTTHQALQEHIRRYLPKDGIANLDNNPLLLHAKLYTLASKYVVPDLPEICLRKLHSLIMVFEINDKSINELIELILYVYENTSDDGEILAGAGDKMRDLLIRYVIDRARAVIQYENFRAQAMLGAGGAPSADFTAVMYG